MWFIMHHCPFSSKVIHCTLPCVKRHSLIRFAEGYGGSWYWFPMDIFWVQVESDWSVVPGVLLHIIHFRHEMDEISRHPTRTWLIGWVITSLQMFTVLYLYISTTNYEIYIYIMITLTFLFPPSEFFGTFLGCWYTYLSQKPRKAAVVRALLLLGAWREVKSRRGETPEVNAGDFLRGGGERGRFGSLGRLLFTVIWC